MQILKTRRTAKHLAPAHTHIELYAITDAHFLVACLNYYNASNGHTAVVQRQPLLRKTIYPCTEVSTLLKRTSPRC